MLPDRVFQVVEESVPSELANVCREVPMGETGTCKICFWKIMQLFWGAISKVLVDEQQSIEEAFQDIGII